MTSEVIYLLYIKYNNVDDTYVLIYMRNTTVNQTECLKLIDKTDS